MKAEEEMEPVSYTSRLHGGGGWVASRGDRRRVGWGPPAQLGAEEVVPGPVAPSWVLYRGSG